MYLAARGAKLLRAELKKVGAFEIDLAGVGLNQPQQHACERRSAATAFALDDKSFTCGDVKSTPSTATNLSGSAAWPKANTVVVHR